MPKKSTKKVIKSSPKKSTPAPKQPKLPKLNDQAGYGHSPRRIVRV